MEAAGVVVPNPIVYTRTRRRATALAASRGSIPRVFLPSVRTTTMSGTYSLAVAGGAGAVTAP